MKFILKVLLLLILTTPIFGEAPHLMLYFDINKTIIASDKAGGKSIEDVLNQLLACKYRDRWDSSISEPISYDTYVRTILLPGADHDLTLKKKRKVILDHFIADLNSQNHPLYPEVFATYSVALEKLQNAQGNVFPSFYRLLKELDREKITYTLILRSFGSEIFDVADEINAHYQEIIKHLGEFKKGTLFVDHERIGSHPSEIYAALRSSTHLAIHDDWEHWMQGEMLSTFGKPFIIDPNDATSLAIFFDDNIDLTDGKTNIIAPLDVTTGHPISIQSLLDQNQIVCVDTLEAILNEDYFVELVQKALDGL